MEAKIGNNILFSFDSIIDIDYSIIKYLQINYRNSDLFKPHVLNGDETFIKTLLVNRTDEDPISIIIKKQYKNNNSLLKDLLENEYKQILDMSYPTDMFGLMVVYNSTDSIKCNISYKNEIEKDHIDSLIDITTVELKDKFSLSKFDTVFIKSHDDINTYINLEGKNLYILNYQFNTNIDVDLENINRKDASYIHNSTVNKLYFIDPYSQFDIKPNIYKRSFDENDSIKRSWSYREKNTKSDL